MEHASLTLAPDGRLQLVPPTGRTYRELHELLGATWADGAWHVWATRSNVVQILELFGDEIEMSEDVLRLGDGPGFPLQPLHDLPRELFRYQVEAVRYLVSNSHGSLLNMSPGLGKTAVAITAARVLSREINPNENPWGLRVLIIAPASLLYTWWREIEKWDPLASIEIAHGNEPLFDSTFTITSYDMVATHPDWFDTTWDLLIVDESVLIKNRTTERYLAIAGGTREATRGGKKVRLKWPGIKASRTWLLSGSPTTRYADDLWTQLRLTYPAAFKSFWRFAERFCIFENNIWSKTGKEIIGTRDSRDITWELGDLMLTVNQEDVLPELPEYLFETVEVELGKSQRRAYTTMLRDFLVELDGKELTADNKLDQLLRLQQITSSMANLEGSDTSSAKEAALLEGIDARRWEFPMIVWTHWRGGAAHLYEAARAHSLNAEWVSGSDSRRVRDAKFEAYKAGETDLLVLSLGVGKFGHTLTNTRTVVYLDKTWSADDYLQSLRRVRRIGLTWRPLLVTLKAVGTSDEVLEMNLGGKMPSISKVTNSQLKELLQGLGL